ncbi:RHS repeat-associated core domain-containing protein [Pseudomonas sp. JR33AA]|uniref:RHS repeat-associated core domain-containing protein n=1 Tax=Pseudomonas sp. JR33AA TaxID=2899113 RepID=UPI001F28BE54|nr:RHS repeat-associated core domain-containing protein [Pseudomonas sp. JR33AA]MCE5979903.1 sugar-binding protein [Pseudomonas sp. JR33AA]
MATTSNAFNFSSFMQSSVDPRTGLYTLSIALPALNANDLCGPDLPLQLNFSPMSNDNYGFGIGWRLKLSSFNITTGMLSLHTGESFTVADNGPGNTPVIAEKKIDSFHFKNISKGERKRLRIAHKGGLVEILEPQENDPETAVPVRVMGASGHGVNLAYDPTTTTTKARLISIADDTGRILLEVKYPTNNRTEFTFNPTTRNAARYTLDLDSNELRKVILPTSSDEYWELHYTLYDKLPFLTKVENPDKGVETITYHEGSAGHKYPGINRYLPSVKEHLVMPDVRDSSTHILTKFTYSNNNFLGNGTGLVYGNEDGTDQLYRFTGHTFEYSSTAKHYRDNKEYRTVVSTFNRFHLMMSQATTDEGCIETIETTYHELENLGFKDQPNHFQLPHTVKKSWAKEGDPTVGDHEETKTTYDIHGNLLTELKPDGTRMERTYYPGADDPEEFERNLESVVIYPAAPSSPGEPLAQIISSEFTYASLPALPQDNPDLNMPEWLSLEQEDIFEGEGEARQLLNSKIRRYLNKVDTPFLHGRVDQQVVQINDATTTSNWKYEKVKDSNDQLTWSRSTEIFTDHTHTLEKKTATTYSMHNGQVVLEHDANNVFTHYEHDVLGRVIAEIASPGTPYATTRTTAYKMLDESGRKRSCEETTDSKGVVTRTVFDGSRRPIREEREARDAVTGEVVKRTVAELNYDSAGRLVSEIGYDYLPDKDGKPEPRVLKLESSYKYDGWGQRCEEVRPDGIKECIDATPLEPGGQLVTRWIESPNAPGHRLQQTVSKLNRFSKPVYEYRLLEEEVDAPEGSKHRLTREAGRTDFTYDGLGRCLSRTESILDPNGGNQVIKRTSKFTYDALGRMTSNQRPDGTTLLRTFAPHSMGELVTELQLKENSNAAEQMLYERKFDGLGRLVRMTVGVRVEEYTYQGMTQLVDKRTAFSLEATSKGIRKRVIGYEYKPELTEQPSKLVATLEDEDGLARQEEQQTADFEYDGESAEITHANNALGKRRYVYTDQGDLCEEHLTDTEGTPYSVTYQQSWQGLPTQRKHSDGQACDYDFDDHGRLVSVVQGNLKSTLTYSEDTGLLETTETRDTTNSDAQQQPVTLCTQHYDSLGRETRRTLSVNGQVRQLVQVWQDNDMLHSRTLWQDEQKLREETFEYDDLGRLTKYDCPVETASGRQIKTQIFRFDAVDNIQRCRTTFNEGDPDDAKFTYCAHDQFRLEKVTHTLPPEGCPPEQTFSYDELGNMLNDECGNALYYDSLGRLHQVQDANRKVTAQYGYDGHDQLLYSGSDARKMQRRYLGHSLDSLLEDGLLTEYLRAGGQPRAQQQAGNATLLLTDHAGSVNTEYDVDGTRHAHYAPYGEQQPEDAEQPLRSLLAFNGEARERSLGWYLLGSGYRAYNPGLMRFHSPDSMPPEEAGINPYVYALGNPVYWHDPTGHRGEPVTRGRQAPLERRIEETPKVPWYAWLGVAALAAIFVVGVITTPWSIPAAIGAGANLAAAVLGGVATKYTYENPELSNLLQNFATVFSVIGMFAAGYASATARGAATAKSAAKGAQTAPAMANTSGKTTIIRNIYTESTNTTIVNQSKIIVRRPRASLRANTFENPRPSTSSAATQTASSNTSVSTQTSAVSPPGAEMKPFLSGKPSVVSRPTGSPYRPNFTLDLTLLGNSDNFMLRRTPRGTFFTGPPR